MTFGRLGLWEKFLLLYLISSSSLCDDFCLFCKCRREQPVERTKKQRGNWHPAGEGAQCTLREREPPQPLGGQGRLRGWWPPPRQREEGLCQSSEVWGSRTGRWAGPGVRPQWTLNCRLAVVRSSQPDGQLLKARPSQAREVRLHGAGSTIPRLIRGR